MKNRAYFITGTDTGAGKTVVSTLLLQAFRQAGQEVYGMKPVASGCRSTASGRVSDDALLLMENSSVQLPYAEVNPVALEAACSPNIAAALEGAGISPEQVEQACQSMLKRNGIVIIEGIGGWRTPVFGMSGMGLVVKRLRLPVILVIGLRLGCINHALLTLDALRSEGVSLAGWIVTQIEPDYIGSEQTVSCLQEAVGIAPLGYIPYLQQIDSRRAHSWLSINRL